ncbi:MAG: SAM-dependent methyltransferase [Kiritimatiellia bacterium]
MNENYQDVLARAASDAAHFRGLTLSGGRDGAKVTARVILLRGKPAVSLTTARNNRETARTFSLEEWPLQVRDLLDQGHTFFHVRRDDGDWHVRITRKGHVLLSHGKPAAAAVPPSEHDRKKEYALSPANAGEFLRSLDALDEHGRIRPSMQAKYRQINGFLALLEPVLPEPSAAPFRICDCGCGSAHLSFAVYHYLSHVQGRPAALTGVDRNGELIEKNLAWRDRLGWQGLQFEKSDLADFHPAEPPGLVLSLHACDTATDLALARAVEWKAGVIIAAPCCQHELHRQLKSDSLQALLRHGILRERLADLVTDAFRAAALRLCGYTVQVIEFASPADTARNLLIRAVRTDQPPGPAAEEYRALKAFWKLEPEIERLLRPHFPDRFPVGA